MMACHGEEKSPERAWAGPATLNIASTSAQTLVFSFELPQEVTEKTALCTSLLELSKIMQNNKAALCEESLRAISGGPCGFATVEENPCDYFESSK